MSRRLWPFKPISPVLDAYSWATDIFRAKASEQRIALRVQPSRTLNFQHEINEFQLSYAQSLIRASLGNGEFYVPDWTQTDFVGALTAGSSVSVNADIDRRIYGDYAVVWQDYSHCEVVEVTNDSNGLTIDALENSYGAAYIMPAWTGSCPAGISANNRGARRASLSVEFVLDAAPDFESSSYDQYRGHDVIPDCSILAGGLSKEIGFELSTFGGSVGNADYIRSRSLPENQFNIRWIKTNNSSVMDLKEWVASRYGRQKSFWTSTSQKDFEPAASINGTTVTVYNDVLIRPAEFDIEVVSNSGDVYRRQVTASAAGTDVGGRPTADFTIDSSINIDISDIFRISYLVCARFDSDRAEFDHSAPGIVNLQMPCVEVPVP